MTPRVLPSRLQKLLSWRLPAGLAQVIVGLGIIVAFAMELAAQTPSSNWVDEVVWRERTDGTPSLVVERLLPGSPRRWDLRRGDRVISFAGVIPESVSELRELADQLDSIDASLEVLRGDRLVTLAREASRPTVGAGPEEILPAESRFEATPANPISSGRDVQGRAGETPSIPLGFQVTEFHPERFQGLDTPVVTGVLVQEVVSESIASRAGLKAGVILVAVDGRRVERPEEVQRWLVERAMVDSITLLGYEGRSLKRFRLDMTVGSSELESLPPTDSSESTPELPLAAPENPLSQTPPTPRISPPRSSDEASQQEGLPGGLETEEIELPEAIELPQGSDESTSSDEETGVRSGRRSDLLRQIERQKALIAEQQRELDRMLEELRRWDAGESQPVDSDDR